MTLIETLRVAWEALAANKMRSILTMLGIIIGVGSVIAIFAIGRGTSAAVEGELSGLASGQIMLRIGGDTSSGRLVRTEFFSERDLELIETMLPDVASVVTSQSFGGTVRYDRETMNGRISGEYARAQEAYDVKIPEGRWFTKAEEDAGARVAVLSYGAAKKLIGEGVSPLNKAISINGSTFDVIGMTEKPTGMLASLAGAEDTTIYVPITYANRTLGNQPIFQVIIKVKDGADANQVLADAIALMEQTHKGAKFSGESFDQLMGAVSTVLNLVTGVLAAVAGISLVVGGVGIMNIMLVSVTERTREIGIRKAIGASYKNILTQFIIEAMLLSLMGGGVGVALAAIPVFAVGAYLKVPLLLDWTSITLALGFSAGVGVIFGVYPAAKAARLDPIDALRYE